MFLTARSTMLHAPQSPLRSLPAAWSWAFASTMKQALSLPGPEPVNVHVVPPPPPPPPPGGGAVGAGVLKTAASENGPVVVGSEARARQKNCLPAARSMGEGSVV